MIRFEISFRVSFWRQKSLLKIKRGVEMKNVSTKILIALLILLGLANILIGINVGFGGMQTLGLQGQTKFFEITNEYQFLVQDSHIRLFGGLYAGIGIFLLIAVTNLRKYQIALNLIFFLIFIGGLTRLTMLRTDIVFGRDIIGSLFAELIIMPALYLWLAKNLKLSDS